MDMPSIQKHQRSQGSVTLTVGRHGLIRMREEGAAKVRLPYPEQAILINTGGGLAGGDALQTAITVESGAALTVTGQAAERVYRSLGPPATVQVMLTAAAQAQLSWLPQETILFDRAALTRSLTVALAADARCLALEAIVFGRTEMAEVVRAVQFRERWRISRAGQLIFADGITVDGAVPRSPATLGAAQAMATLIYVAPDAEARLDRLRAAIAGKGGASAWNGKLIARVLAPDGFELRKALIPAIHALAGASVVPKLWAM